MPHLLSNCVGTLSSTGLRKLSTSGSVTRHAGGLQRVDKARLLVRQLLVLPGDAVGDRRLDDGAVGIIEAFPEVGRSR